MATTGNKLASSGSDSADAGLGDFAFCLGFGFRFGFELLSVFVFALRLTRVAFARLLLVMRDIWLILHFVGLALGPGAAFAMLILSFSVRKTPPADRGPIQPVLAILGRIGPSGLVLLIISGLALAWPTFGSLLKVGLFHLKLTLVGIMFLLTGYMHAMRARARRTGGVPTIPAWLVPVPSILSLAVIVTAVLIFH